MHSVTSRARAAVALGAAVLTFSVTACSSGGDDESGGSAGGSYT